MPSSTTLPWHKRSDSAYVPSVPGDYFHKSRANVKLFGGAVGGTKTTTLAVECINLSTRYANNRGFCAERDFDDLRRGLYTEIMEWLPENVKLTDGRDLYQHHKSEHWIKFYNGSEIHFIELKDEPRNVNLGWAAIDQAERVPEKSYEWMHTRLRLEHIDYRPLMMSANPEPGWLHKKCVLGGEEVRTGITRSSGDELVVFEKDDILFIPSFPQDNEHLPEGYIEGLYRNLSPTRVDRLLRGIWDTVENAIYPQVDRSVQLKPMPKSFYWIDGAGGADYGTVHLSAVVMVTKESDGQFWVRACWADKTGDPEVIKGVATGYKVKYGFSKGRTDPNQAVLAYDLGWTPAKTGKGSRRQRIDRVTRLLNAGQLMFDIDGPGVMELFEEMMAYRFERRETELIEEDVVVRKGEDRVAALEYAIEELEYGFSYTPPVTRVIKYAERVAGAIAGRPPKRPNINSGSSIGYRIGR